MASENETVAEIVKELRDEPLAENGAKPWLHYLADRIEEAHKRELNQLPCNARDVGIVVARNPEMMAKVNGVHSVDESEAGDDSKRTTTR